MQIDDFRSSALARYKDAALESAVLVLALSRAPVHSHFDDGLYDLVNVRADIRMLNEMHLLCYNARKALEIASVVNPAIRLAARQMTLPGAGQSVKLDYSQTIKTSNINYSSLLNRFIHSLSSSVVNDETILSVVRMRIYSERRRRFVEVGSDQDKVVGGAGTYSLDTREKHYVEIDAFLACFMGIDRMIREALEALRPPL